MINNYNNQKIFNIILGAGFSKAIANLPLTQEIDEEIFELNNESSESSKLYKYLKSRDENTNFEDIIGKFQSLENTEEIFNFYSETEPFYFNETNSENEIHKNFYRKLKSPSNEIFNKLKEILYSTLIYKKNNELEEISSNFIYLLNSLIEDGFSIQIFDLNYDNVFEQIIKESDLSSSYLDFFNIKTDLGYHFNPAQLKLFKDSLINDQLPIDKLHDSKKTDDLNQQRLNEKKKYYNDLLNIYFEHNSFSESEIYEGFDKIYSAKIFHFKPHGAINLNKRDRNGNYIIYPYKVNEPDNKLFPFIITGTQKYLWLADKYIADIFNLLRVPNPCLTIGYSFNLNDIIAL